MKKYRIRLLDKRVIGPFTAKEIEILLNKRRITGDEDFQEFPTGDWASLSMLPNLEQQLSGNMEDDPTFVRKLSDIGFNSNGVDLKFPKEFEFESDLYQFQILAEGILKTNNHLKSPDKYLIDYHQLQTF